MLIVGAGPAGCATALALRRAGVAGVMCVDEAPMSPPGWRIGESATPDVPDLLARLGCAMPEGHHPYWGNWVAWGGPPRLEDFQQRRKLPGWQLDRARFDHQLRESAQAAGVALCMGWRLSGAERAASDGVWTVQLQASESSGAKAVSRNLRARVLVDASGRRAALARWLGAQRQRLDQQVALAVRCPPEVLHPDGRALVGRVWVEAVASGWWYATVLPDASVLLSLMTDQDLARSLRQPEVWLAALRGTHLSQWLALGALAASVSDVPPQSVAAHSACTQRVAGPGWLAVGDAMLSLDPLTSSGIAGALRDAVEATQRVLLPWLAGDDPAVSGRAWGERAQRMWLHFVQQRGQMYAQVQQWPDAPYWRRRTLSSMGA